MYLLLCKQRTFITHPFPEVTQHWRPHRGWGNGAGRTSWRGSPGSTGPGGAFLRYLRRLSRHRRRRGAGPPAGRPEDPASARSWKYRKSPRITAPDLVRRACSAPRFRLRPRGGRVRGMILLKARVQHGRLLVDEPTELPEGTELDLIAIMEDALEGRDALDEEERAALHAALDEAIAQDDVGDTVDADEVLAICALVPRDRR